MDRNAKFLKKLTKKELGVVKRVLEKLEKRQCATLNIQKLSGHHSVYRVRTRDIRIIFYDDGKMLRVLEIARRNENTYKQY